MLCSEASLVNHGMGKVRAITLRCRAWTCSMCLPMRKGRLVNDVADGRPSKLLTLTTRFVEGADPVLEARRQGAAFVILIRLIRKRYSRHEIAYFVVREATKRGWPHLHVALRSPILDWTWLVETWEKLTGSRGVDIRRVYETASAAKYLAKYIGKAPHRFGTTKRYWSSRNWFDVRPERKLPDRSWSQRWEIVDQRVCEIAETYWLRRWVLTLAGSLDYFEARAPP